MKTYTHTILRLNHSIYRVSILILGLSFLFGFSMLAKSPPVIFTDVEGTIWIDIDNNNMFDGELGPSGVIVELIDSETFSILDTAFSVSGDYKFSGVLPGEYFLRIPESEFALGNPLNSSSSCTGFNDADDMVDDDDNGSDTAPGGVRTTVFTLTNNDPANSILIDYIDFCFSFSCNGENALANQACDDILPSDIICDISTLGSFCNTMPSGISSGTQPDPLCPDGSSSAENISWFGFIAFGGLYDIVVNPFACDGNLGVGGIQVGIYEDCSFTESVFCTEDCSSVPVTISSTNLIPGQIYYLFIDGCEGSVCSYSIDLLGSPISPNLAPEKVCLNDNGQLSCDTTQYCIGGDAIFQATEININANFQWQISTISGDPYTGDPAPITTNSELAVAFSTEGLYEVCLTGVSNGCAAQSWFGNLCQLVEISSNIPIVSDEVFSDQTICLSDPSAFDVSVFSSDDPNSDGILGWQGPVDNFIFGLNEALIPTPGCTYKQEFELTLAIPGPPVDVDITVCGNDLPITIEGIVITDLNFAGDNVLVIESILSNTPDQFGCDSLINLTIEKLDIVGGTMAPPLCTFNSVILDFDFDPSLSTSFIFLDFEWKDPLGNVIPDFDNDPTSVELSSSNGISGTYTLIIEIDKNGTICLFEFPVEVDFGGFLPPTPSVSGITMICENQGNAVVYTATGGDAEFNYIWTFPNDVASAQTSGILDNMLTVDWTGSNGGIVTVKSENACGISEAASLSVDVLQVGTPDFSLAPAVCQGDNTDVVFSASTTGISQYQWNFGGGTITNGSGAIGPGPHAIAWNTPGTKTVTIRTISNDGCASDVTSKTIDVEAPLDAPIISCSSSIDEILFLWPSMSDAEYEVNVITGQTGTFVTANTFNVTGINPGEEVTIEVIATSTNGVCTESVSSTITCVAIDCPPVNIVLDTETSICLTALTEPFQISVTVSDGGGGTGIFIGPGIIDQNGTFDPQEADLGDNSIIYTYMNENGCTYFESIDIEVIEQPVAEFITSVDTLCVTDVVAVTYTGSESIDMFTWDFGGGQGSATLDTELSFDTPGQKTISIQVFNGGCTSTFEKNIFVLDEPDASFTISSTTICIGDLVSLSYSGNTNVDMFTWDFDGGQGENNLDTEVSFTTPGSKNILLEIDNGFCTSFFNQTVTVEPELENIIISCSAGEGSIEFSWNNITGISGYEVMINNQTPITTDLTSFSVIDLGSNEEVTITVTAISNGVCPSVLETITCVSFTVSTNEESIRDLKIFPNPTSNLLFLENVDSGTEYTITNSNGQPVMRGTYKEGISTNELTTGIYFIKVKTETESVRIKRFLKL